MLVSVLFAKLYINLNLWKLTGAKNQMPGKWLLRHCQNYFRHADYDTVLAAEHGEFVLGGCCVSEDDSTSQFLEGG